MLFTKKEKKNSFNDQCCKPASPNVSGGQKYSIILQAHKLTKPARTHTGKPIEQLKQEKNTERPWLYRVFNI